MVTDGRTALTNSLLTRISRRTHGRCRYLAGVMRKLALLACAASAAVALAGTGSAAETPLGTLSVEHGKGVVVLDLRGSVLGRLASGTLRVTDQTPNDRFGALVVGKKVVQTRIGPKTVLYKGQGLRFRMLGGGTRMLARGTGIDISAVGRGAVVLDGDPRFVGDDAGVYSLEGVDCDVEPESCVPLPADPTRLVIGPTVSPGAPGP